MNIFESFGVQPVLLAAQIVNFLVLLFIMKKFMYGPIIKTLESRKQKIAQSLKNAEAIEVKLQKTEEDREEKLKEAAIEARDILTEASKSASQIVADARKKAESDIEIMVEKGRESIKLEREKMQKEIREELADLVVIAMEKVTQKVLTEKDKREIVERTVKEL